MNYTVTLVQVAPRTLACVRQKLDMANIPPAIIGSLDLVWPFIRAGHATKAGHNIAIYRMGPMELEVGVEVAPGFEPAGRIVRGATPGGLAATTVHLGPYSELRKAHEAVGQWCAEHDRTPAGVSWEIYADPDDDPAKLRTDVFWLLR
jgi:effector-binding domain-containing protein